MKQQQNNYFDWKEYSCIIVGGTWPIEAYKANKDKSEYYRSYYKRKKKEKQYAQSRGHNVGADGRVSRQ